MSMIFKIYESGEFAPQHRISYFGWEGYHIQGIYNYLIGYEKACNVIYSEFERAAVNMDIATQDTLVFPLCFNYRQAIELFLKYFFIKYCSQSDEDTATFIKKVGHDLLKMWRKIKTRLHYLAERQRINETKFQDIEDGIKEWHEFDNGSFKMRYPMQTNNTPTHNTNVRIDIVNMKEQMDLYLYKLHEFDNCIDNQICLCEYNDEEIKYIEKLYNQNSRTLKEVLKRITAKDSNSNEVWNDISFELKELLKALFLSARDVEEGVIKLAKNNDKKRDFIQLVCLNISELKSSLESQFINEEEKFQIKLFHNMKSLNEMMNIAFSIMDT